MSAALPPAQGAPSAPSSPSPEGLRVLPVTGLTEIREGDDLAAQLGAALRPLAPQDGDVLCLST
ncbi:MAG: coenzyme F420-0:L-glutamate ligase, partial [Brachybacterium sp.]